MDKFKSSIHVVYVDPPFDTGDIFSCKATVETPKGRVRAKSTAYKDQWQAGGAYLELLREMLGGLIKLLHPRGSLFVHLDWRASHHARLLLDELLTPSAFRAEIIWRYRRWPTQTQNLQRMHDTILYYASGPGAVPVFHTLYEPLAASTLQAFGTQKQRADFSTGERRPGVLPEESPGVPLSDVWDVGIVAPSGKERVGYPTQKPEKLLERILQISSNQGDLVLDCCSGSGTTAAVAERLGRRWIVCDVGGPAVQTTLRRLLAKPNVKPLLEQRIAGTKSAQQGQIFVKIQGEGRHIELELTDYRGPSGEQGLSWVVAWAVDGFHEEGVFQADGWFCRPHRRAPMETKVSLTFLCAGEYPIVVRVQDALGNEARWEGQVHIT